MEKRLFYNHSYMRDTHVSRVRFGDRLSVPIDQAPSQKFNIDPATGRPMSDIQRLVKVQNEVSMQAQFAQLHEFKSNYLPADVSDEDALKFMCPRLSQLPSELFDYKNKLAEYQLNKEHEAAVLKAQKEQEEADKKFWADLKQEVIASKSNSNKS